MKISQFTNSVVRKCVKRREEKRREEKRREEKRREEKKTERNRNELEQGNVKQHVLQMELRRRRRVRGGKPEKRKRRGEVAESLRRRGRRGDRGQAEEGQLQSEGQSKLSRTGKGKVPLHGGGHEWGHPEGQHEGHRGHRGGRWRRGHRGGRKGRERWGGRRVRRAERLCRARATRASDARGEGDVPVRGDRRRRQRETPLRLLRFLSLQLNVSEYLEGLRVLLYLEGHLEEELLGVPVPEGPEALRVHVHRACARAGHELLEGGGPVGQSRPATPCTWTRTCTRL